MAGAQQVCRHRHPHLTMHNENEAIPVMDASRVFEQGTPSPPGRDVRTGMATPKLAPLPHRSVSSWVSAHSVRP
jgi:hypothetical protein